MADQKVKDLQDDDLEQEDGADGDAKAPEDVSALKNALARQKETNKALKLALSESKAEAAFNASLPKGVKNPKAIRTLAREFGMLNEDGSLDLKAFKAEFPQLISGSPPGSAGEGTDKPASGKMTMNEWIRAKAGRN